MKLKLTEEQYNLLKNEIKGQGGFQSLQKKLLSQIDEHLVLSLEEDDIEKICRYVTKYGQGGAQKQFFAVFKDCLECL